MKNDVFSVVKPPVYMLANGLVQGACPDQRLSPPRVRQALVRRMLVQTARCSPIVVGGGGRRGPDPSGWEAEGEDSVSFFRVGGHGPSSEENEQSDSHGCYRQEGNGYRQVPQEITLRP